MQPRVRPSRRARLQYRASFDLQGERNRDDVAVRTRLQEQAPRSGHGNENTDAELPRRRRSAGDARAAERARTAARAGRANVRVEVVERPGLEEDRVRERAVPRREPRRL